MDMDALTAAFRSHVQDSDKFTRRMAIALAEMDGTTPRQLVLRCEGLRLLKQGSWDWFVENGGITKAHIEQARTTVPASTPVRSS
jgi:hypothetical protein